MAIAFAADGTPIYYVEHGDANNPSVFLGPHCFASANTLLPPEVADATPGWIEGLSNDFHLILADYPRGMGRTPNALGMEYTPALAVADLTAIIDAVGVERVAWVGYSYGGAVGVQFACRSDRLSAVVIGGWPPLNQPLTGMVTIATDAAHDAARERDSAVDPALMWSSVGFYRALVGWPERDEVSKLAIPRMTFMGSNDVREDIALATILRGSESELKRLGWEVNWLDGRDHESAMAAEVSIPVVHDFLVRKLKS